MWKPWRQAMDGMLRTSSAPRSACRSSMRISAADDATPRYFAAVSRVLDGGTHSKGGSERPSRGTSVSHDVIS